MKKVMFLVVGMLFAANVNAASLTLSADGANDVNGSVGYASGELVTASWDSSQAGGETISDMYTVTTDEFTGGYLTVTFNPLTAGSTVSINDGTGATALNINPVGALGLVEYFWVLSAGTSYDIYIDISNAVSGSNYDLRIETPIPAALFLFAPALLGFFGLRRKAAVAA